MPMFGSEEPQLRDLGLVWNTWKVTKTPKIDKFKILKNKCIFMMLRGESTNLEGLNDKKPLSFCQALSRSQAEGLGLVPISFNHLPPSSHN
jgi:hypothetical protein